MNLCRILTKKFIPIDKYRCICSFLDISLLNVVILIAFTAVVVVVVVIVKLSTKTKSLGNILLPLLLFLALLSSTILYRRAIVNLDVNSTHNDIASLAKRYRQTYWPVGGIINIMKGRKKNRKRKQKNDIDLYQDTMNFHSLS
mgnify:FL=1